jgi:hypothetical protein
MSRCFTEGPRVGCFKRIYVVYWRSPGESHWRCDDRFTPYESNAANIADGLRGRGSEAHVANYDFSDKLPK